MIWFAVAWASLTFEPEPAEGSPTVITVVDDRQRPRSGETVRVVHRPELAATVEQAIGITDARGQVKWTPSQPGVAIVRAGDEASPVHVAAAASRPVIGLLLGLLALGAAAAVGYGSGFTPRRP
jgi:hypothetical protein